MGGCVSDDDCDVKDSCINRQCRNPCSCGLNTECFVKNHKPICSCETGYEGNPDVACYSVECQRNDECSHDKSCVNNNCVNPCLFTDTCGVNTECFVSNHEAKCRCRPGYHGVPEDKCRVIGCYSNSDCPSERSCVNMQCVDPCLRDDKCSPLAECRVLNHLPICRCPFGFTGNPYISCQPPVEPECRQDDDCPRNQACLNQKCQNPCLAVVPCTEPSDCRVMDTHPVRTMSCVCPSGYISSGSGTCRAVGPLITVECTRDDNCPENRACINSLCKDPCACGTNAICKIQDHKPICSCLTGFDGDPYVECITGAYFYY